MDAYGNPDDLDSHGNEPHDVFGNHDRIDVWGNPPADVWGTQCPHDSSDTSFGLTWDGGSSNSNE